MKVQVSNTADLKNYSHKLIVETNDWWETISETEKKDIETGLKQLDAGNKIEYKNVRQKVDKLLGRI